MYENHRKNEHTKGGMNMNEAKTKFDAHATLLNGFTLRQNV